MKFEYDLWVLGGDPRQGWLARLLAGDGHRVHTFGLDQLSFPLPDVHQETTLDHLGNADCVILPMPVSDQDGALYAPLSQQTTSFADVLTQLHSRQLICGGRPSPSVRAMASERGLSIIDLFSREELAVANCVPTAEGCIQLAMEQLPITIHNARVLIIGFGRVGKLCAQRFAALGAKITVAARKYDQLAWAETSGFDTRQVSRLKGQLGHFDLVVNTVPSLVLGEAELESLPAGCLIIDLASKPGGVDKAAAEHLNCQVIHALSLPGKVAPATAGTILKDTLYHVMAEHGLR